MFKGKRLLVISAHAADYVWRSGGTIAKYVKQGAQVKVVVLSFGVRGESNDLWKQPGQTSDGVKDIRLRETKEAAAHLGITDISFWDMEDYPLRFGRDREEALVRVIREFRPDYIITHDKNDILNPDHNTVHDVVWRCSVMSNSNGVNLEDTVPTKQMQLYGFEPHQTEISGYVPTLFVDITDTYEQKVAAMNCFKAQQHLIEYYTQRAFMRGNHARRISGNQSFRYAESFAKFMPVVSEGLL